MRRRPEPRSGLRAAAAPGAVSAAVLLVLPLLSVVSPAPSVREAGPPAATALGTADVLAPDPFRRPPPEVLRARRARLLDTLGQGVALLRSATPKSLEGDYPQASDFRQDNDFLYLTGLETPDSWLLLGRDGPGGTLEILFVPERDPSEERWTGPRPGFEEASRLSGIGDVRAAPEFERMAEAGALEGLPGPLHLPLARGALDSPLLRRVAAGAGGGVRGVEPLMARLRITKDAFELETLRRAVAITDRAQRAAMRAIRPGMWEYEAEAVIEYVFRAGGAERVGFPSIVGSGPNSTVLHYDRSRRKMEAGDLVVMDVGAEYSYYSADVTRTVPVSGRFTERQREIYDLVLGARRAGIEAVRPGATVADVERAARSYLRAHSGGACGERSCDAFFVHGVGHWLGMDVHDVGDYATPFRPGMVLTVEPGIYLPDEALGVRIEDDVLVTEAGAEVLSSGSPTDPDAIEALMREEWRPEP